MNEALPSIHGDPAGMTLAEYAGARGTHPQEVRKDYQRIMRGGELTLPEVTRRTDDPDGTIKFCLPAGEFGGKGLESESVIISMVSFEQSRWYTLCLSSQIGCRMGCSFCETGRMGLLRNLTPAEIVRQRLVARTIRQQVSGPGAVSTPSGFRYFGDGIQNIVFMGMGEPLDNFDNVIQAIRVFTDPVGLNFPHTQITVSTVGRVDGLKRLAELCKAEPIWRNLRIAISLNAGRDDLRDELMPINKGMPLEALKGALLEYPLVKKGRFLIEYVLIKGVNDSLGDAELVAKFCEGLPCVVNLIPYNPQRFASYETPEEESILNFMAYMKEKGVFTKRRVTHGRELMGACGQLGNPEVKRVNGVKVTVGATVAGGAE